MLLSKFQEWLQESTGHFSWPGLAPLVVYVWSYYCFLVLFSKVNVLLMRKCSAFMFVLQIALAINIIILSFWPCNFMYISRNAKVLILYLFMVSKRPTQENCFSGRDGERLPRRLPLRDCSLGAWEGAWTPSEKGGVRQGDQSSFSWAKNLAARLFYEAQTATP